VLALIGGAASGLSRIGVGNALITGLPRSSDVHRAYDAVQHGFAPGVVDPALVLVSGNGTGYQHAGLVRLQRLIARQPDVAQVIGPEQRPFAGRSGVFLADSGAAARYIVILASDPLAPRAISAVDGLRASMPKLIDRAGLPRAHAAVGGDTAISADIISGTVTSLERVLPAVLGLVFLVIALYLRALTAPAALVLTSVLAVVAAIGLTVYVLGMLLGYGQITYYVLFTVAVLLVSLGSDYNVFVVGRIWQEARRRPLREAIEVAGSRAARPITTAGLVLAMSFALLAIVPLRAFREIAFAMAVGLLIDTLLVRTILVPALLSLVGKRAGWPGHAIDRPPSGGLEIGFDEAPASRAA
jgi:RND superfamily putative drug exporter